jgi:hypothetical protein
MRRREFIAGLGAAAWPFAVRDEGGNILIYSAACWRSRGGTRTTTARRGHTAGARKVDTT